MMKLRVFVWIWILAANALALHAQIRWVQVGINGLTCSQCSRSVEMSIRKLEFVADVQMDLENTEGRITFKPGVKIDVDKIAGAVYDAGFSVRYLKAGMLFTNFDQAEHSCYLEDGVGYQFISPGAQVLNGETTVTFVGKKFLPLKEYKAWKNKLKSTCSSEAKKVYYVTL